MIRRFSLPAVLAGVVVSLVSSGAHAGLTYFLVAERPGEADPHNDSFVIGIDEAADVAHARDLVARGPEAAGAPIVFAEVSKGNPDDLNRDLLDPDYKPWNWHVSKFTGFGDMGIELVDGWPTFVESDVDGWINNTNGGVDGAPGQIGFWNYTVVRELPDYPAIIPDLPGGPAQPVPLPAGVWAGGLMLLGVAGYRWRAKRMAAAA